MSSKNFLKFIFLIFFIFLCILTGRFFHIDVEHYRVLLSRYPLQLSGFIYILIYVALTSFFWIATKDVLRIAGALLFGAAVSTILVVIAEMINSTIIFHISRFLGRKYVEEKLKLDNNYLEKAEKNTSALSIIALKINVFIPSRLIDIGYGLTRVSFGKFLICILVASIPRVFWLQMALENVGMAVFTNYSEVINYVMRDKFFINYSMLYIASIIFISITAMMFKLKIKKA